MNKHIALVTCMLISLLFVAPASYALTSTPSPTSKVTTTPNPTKESVTEALSEQISDLKEKIASRVAQMNLVEKRGIAGIATEVDDTQITLTDIYGDTRFIDVDEITKFSSPDEKKDSFGISDIEEGTEISILGLYNKQSERMLARFVTVINVPEFIHGEIMSLDEDEFSVDVKTDEDKTVTVDVERSTVTQEYVDEDFERSGFSKMEIGQKVFITAYAGDEENRFTGSRILILVPQEPTITAAPQETEE